MWSMVGHRHDAQAALEPVGGDGVCNHANAAGPQAFYQTSRVFVAL